LHEEINLDFYKIVYAECLDSARLAYDRFVKKWQKGCRGVVRSLQEAVEGLLTFFRYHSSQWKGLRTTNIVEKIEGEFRRRIKTQSSFPNESSIIVLLFGLFARQSGTAGSYEEIERLGGALRGVEKSRLMC
jgi:transposase-like protein